MRRSKAAERKRLQQLLGNENQAEQMKKECAPEMESPNVIINEMQDVDRPWTARVESLEKKIDMQTEIIKRQQAQLKQLADQIADQNAYLRQLIIEKKESENIHKVFPLEKEEDLMKLEEALGPETQEIYVAAMRAIVSPVGIKKGLRRILSDSIVSEYNIHGVKSKKGLISMPKFYRALLDSIPGSTGGNAEDELRIALIAQKKNVFKKKAFKRKAEGKEYL